MGTRKKTRRKKPPASSPRKKQPRKKTPPSQTKRKTRAKPAPRKKSPPPRSSERKKKKQAPRTRDWRSSSASRREVLGALKKVAGSLVGRITRAGVDQDETVYLRGIANLKLGKKLTPAQSIMVLAASRASSFISELVFGKRERKLVDAFLKRNSERAFTKTRTPMDILKHCPDISPGIAMQLADAHASGKDIYYQEHKGGAIQRWSADGFRRFISNPIYKTRRARVFSGGKFFSARSVIDNAGRRMAPKKGRTKFRLQ